MNMQHDNHLHTSHGDTRRGNSEPPRATSVAAKRMLLLDDDPDTLKLLALLLSRPSVEVFVAQSGGEALGIAQRRQFDLILADLWLPDMTGLEVIRRLRRDENQTPFILISGAASIPAAVEAMKLGALHVFEKPLTIDSLTEAIDVALWPNGARPPEPMPPAAAVVRGRESVLGVEGQPGSAVQRWASFVMKAVHADTDIRTLDSWAHLIGVSRSGLCECCRIVHVSPRAARDFARVLRAVYRSAEQWQPETLIDFADVRTLKRLEARAGLNRIGELHHLTVEDFLRHQQLIPEDHPGLTVIRRLLDVKA